MLYLFLVSLLWAFSFGLIKGGLSDLPSSSVAFMRLFIAFAVFAPFLRIRSLRLGDALRLLLTGAVQYGVMYVAYIHAFQTLKAYEVALFTVFTPIYVTLINDGFERRLNLSALGAVILAVAGGVIIKYQQLDSAELWRGFALMQVANLCFAFGQIFYRRTMARLQRYAQHCGQAGLPNPPADRQVFGLLYLGAAFTAALATIGSDWGSFELTLKQSGILLYLGIIASGLGFFLWNLGARRVSAGALAVFNNLKIPLGILVSVLVFGEKTEWMRLAAGGALMAAALVVNAQPSSSSSVKI
ncbi:MAG: EamA family transporter [Kiritimatiellaeota bacterium]|nr:EamA family transporter [Kiritimatiellota bacterium]